MKWVGRGLGLFLRYFFGLFFAFAAKNKFDQDYLFSDYLVQVLTRRLDDLDPLSFQAWNIQNFLIPNYQFVSWIVAWGELAVAVSLLLGLCTRVGAWIAVFIMVNLSLGGYFDGSMVVLTVMALIIALLPSGRWFGLDRYLHARYPDAIWFK